MADVILVLNAGSSSLKFSVFEIAAKELTLQLKGQIEGIGTAPRFVAKSAEAQFLRRLHKGACGVFGTVLGPEANEAHRDHFHFDLAHRRNSAYCQ